MIFGFQKDRQLLWISSSLLAVLFAAGVALLLLASDWGFALGLGLLLLGTGILAVLFPSRYRIDSRHLHVRIGPFRWRIALQSIESVETLRIIPCYSAWSRDALRITFRGRRGLQFLLVSPTDPRTFTHRLMALTQARVVPITRPNSMSPGRSPMDRMSSIKMALKNEETEMNFYENEARRSRNPLAKAMFENLAQDEQEHMSRIQRLHQRLLSDGAWPEEMPIEVAGTNIKKTLDKLVSQEGSSSDHDDDDIKALHKAIDFEAQGARFYAELAKICESAQEKRFFDFLAQIEREHHLSLTDSLAYLQDPEAWMMQHERSGLDGA